MLEGLNAKAAEAAEKNAQGFLSVLCELGVQTLFVVQAPAGAGTSVTMVERSKGK
jgi:hypothetical protein